MPAVTAALDAGKHVFFEKPVATDPAGIRKVLAAADVARAKKLCVVTGTQRRHERCYLEMMQRIKDGAIGKVVSASCYWKLCGFTRRCLFWCASRSKMT